MAGGIAAMALAKGWEWILGTWATSPQLGGHRGGWTAVAKIREAQDLLAGNLPPALQDMPSVQEIADQMKAKAMPKR